MGFEFQNIETDVSDFNPKYGQLSFTGYFSDPCYATNASCVNSLSTTAKDVYGLADFIFGAPSNYTLNNNPVAHYRQQMYFGYIQDDFKVNNRLTLNLGIRYEFATPQYTSNNQLANFNPVTDSLIYASSGSLYNRALVHPDPNDWAPRVGLAYTVRPKTVIRSAYGIVQRPVHHQFLDQPASQPGHLRQRRRCRRNLFPLSGAGIPEWSHQPVEFLHGHLGSPLHPRQ
jgi:outer membrane receptor protein involved in Fe transport